MNNTTVALVIIAAVTLAIVLRYRAYVKVTLKGLGLDFSAEGKDDASQIRRSTQIEASGERSVGLGGNLTGNITTGDGDSPPTGRAAGRASSTTTAQSPEDASDKIVASGNRAVAVRGDVTGNITTGNQNKN